MTRYAARHGYAHRLVESAHKYAVDIKFGKPRLLTDELARMRREENGEAETKWLVYFDLDVCVMDASRRLESIVAEAEAVRSGGGRCSVVGQDSAETANTGFLMFRDDLEGRAVLRRWVEEVEAHRNDPNLVAYQTDQRSFQYALLHMAAAAAATRTEGKGPAPYDDECARLMGSASEVNVCYARRMAEWGLKHNERSFGPICMLPDNTPTTRVNMHDSGQEYKAGDMLWHNHAAPPPLLAPAGHASGGRRRRAEEEDY